MQSTHTPATMPHPHKGRKIWIPSSQARIGIISELQYIFLDCRAHLKNYVLIFSRKLRSLMEWNETRKIFPWIGGTREHQRLFTIFISTIGLLHHSTIFPFLEHNFGLKS
jgi:hypothetical protein